MGGGSPKKTPPTSEKAHFKWIRNWIKSFMEDIETIPEYNASKKYLSLHFSKITKSNNYPLSPERIRFLSNFL